ncbi:hypothetical protein [Novosphingobium sp. LASN5T]|uniref:hypothetical protein n=1 Tax=Novosphingobium sp. LASN5T TaxID=2491021 RepID=UPI000F5DB029|nr:hypothetical protein [Novosphingobium sp. LASN5T]RQW44679.1 hypothetical protein EH199_08070 [Novosphingobium sp. LASN5T]
MIDDNGPALWGRLLEEIGDEHAVVAGGCIRDYELGLPPKDIDIFIVGDRQVLSDLVSELNFQRVADLTLLNYQGEYDSYDDPLVGVAEGTLLGVAEGTLLGVAVNIIANERMAQGPEYLVEGFDYAVTQGWWRQGMANPCLTYAAREDIDNRTATLLTQRCYERSLRRLDKYNLRNGHILKLVDPFQRSFSFAPILG